MGNALQFQVSEIHRPRVAGAKDNPLAFCIFKGQNLFMPDDKDQWQSQEPLHKDNDPQSSFPREETTTRITKSDDNGPRDLPPQLPKENKSSE